MDDSLRQRRLRDRCTTYLTGHGNRTAAVHLAELGTSSDGIEHDVYGAGGVVEKLETEVASVLGKPAAVLMPTGTMAQQIALRIHADRLGRRTVVMHPTAHPAMHEDEALGRLHQLRIRPAGDARTWHTTSDLDAISEPVAALLIELPQREIGGWLPTWGELEAQCRWAREQGGVAHMDGARLWESGPFYERPYAEIAALFDSVYVSLYKGLGGIGGACLAGEDSFVAEAREWRHRLGGMIFGMWPYAASGLAGLRLRLDRMPIYLAHAKQIADALRDVEGVEVTFDPPYTPMLHLSVRTTEAAFRAQTIRIATTEGLWTWPGCWATDRPMWRRVELSVGEATLEMPAVRIADLVAQLIAPGPSEPGERLVEVVDEAGAVVDVASLERVQFEKLRHRRISIDMGGEGTGESEDVGGICLAGESWGNAATRILEDETGRVGVRLEDRGELPSAADADSPFVGRRFVVRTEADG